MADMQLFRGAVVLDGIFLVVAIVQCVYSIITLKRSQGHRGAFVAVLVAVFANAFSHVLGIVRFGVGNRLCESGLQSSDTCSLGLGLNWWSFNYRGGQMLLLAAWWNFMVQWTDSLLLLASLIALYQRSAVMHDSHPHKQSGYPRAWWLVGCVAIGCMLLITFIRTIVMIVQGTEYISGNVDTFHGVVFVPTVLNCIYSVIYFITTLALVSSAWSARKKMTAVSANDKALNALIKYVTPLIVAHCTVWIFYIAIGSRKLFVDETFTDPRLAFVIALDNDAFPCALITIFFWLGYNSRFWWTFGDAESVNWPTAPRHYTSSFDRPRPASLVPQTVHALSPLLNLEHDNAEEPPAYSAATTRGTLIGREKLSPANTKLALSA